MKTKILVLFSLIITVVLLLLSFNSAIGQQTIKYSRSSISPLFSIRTDQKLGKNSVEISTNHIGDTQAQSSISLPQLSEAKGLFLVEKIRKIAGKEQLRDIFNKIQPQNSIDETNVLQQLSQWLVEAANAEKINSVTNPPPTYSLRSCWMYLLLFCIMFGPLLFDIVYKFIFGEHSTIVIIPSVCIQC